MVAADKPEQMSKVVVSQVASSTQVTFSWTEPTTNGLAITQYIIKLKSSVGTNNYTEHTSLCNGGIDPALSQHVCNIEMASLISTLSLSAGDYIKATAIAVNERGQSIESEASDDSVRTKVAPTVAPSGLAGTATKDSITLTWSQITSNTDTGYSAITTYRVYNSTSGSDVLVGTLTAPTVTITFSSMTPSGNTFSYKVTAVNIHGEGPKSTAYNQLLAGIPDTMAAPVLTQSGTALTFTWSVPNNNGAALDKYTLLLLDMADSTYREYTSICNGTDHLASSTPACTIEMAVFTSTLSYTIGQPISAKVTAHNLKGTSDISPASNTIVAQSAPTA